MPETIPTTFLCLLKNKVHNICLDSTKSLDQVQQYKEIIDMWGFKRKIALPTFKYLHLC